MPKKKKLSKQEKSEKLFRNLSSIAKVIGTDSNWVMGFDPGRVSPGIAFEIMGEESNMEKFTINTKLSGFGKVIEVEAWFAEHIKRKPPGLIMMEDYAFATEFGREKAGEVCGVIKRNVWLRGIPLITVTPMSLKSFVGVMKKDEIMKEVLRKWDIDTKNSDEADAVVLAKMGVGIARVVRAGMILADEKERKLFEAHPHKFVTLKEKEARAIINLITNKGDMAYDFATAKKKARKAQGKQKQTKVGKNTSKK